MNWVVPPEWVGDVVFILGCGPSLANYSYYDFENVRRAGRVIAVNDSYIKAPWADVLYAHDQKWWDSNVYQIHNRFMGRYMISIGADVSRVKRLRDTGQSGLETDPAGLRNGSNSGYQAINLAYHFGARRIVLLGFDMQVHGQQTHWRERNDGRSPVTFGNTLRLSFLPLFPSLAEGLREEGVSVINATPGSALTVWPHAPLAEVLRNIDNQSFWERQQNNSRSAFGVGTMDIGANE